MKPKERWMNADPIRSELLAKNFVVIIQTAAVFKVWQVDSDPRRPLLLLFMTKMDETNVVLADKRDWQYDQEKRLADGWEHAQSPALTQKSELLVVYWFLTPKMQHSHRIHSNMSMLPSIGMLCVLQKKGSNWCRRGSTHKQSVCLQKPSNVTQRITGEFSAKPSIHYWNSFHIFFSCIL